MKYDRVVNFRARKESIDLVEDICKNRGEDISDFLRRCIRKELARMSYLSEKEKRALEMDNIGDEKNDRKLDG